MDIVNELEGHNGCVNALWWVSFPYMKEPG
jgi:hypothetical protein